MQVIGTYKELVLFGTVAVWFLLRKRSEEVWLPWLGALLIAVLFAELSGKALANKGVNNHFLYNVVFVVEFSLITRMIYITWQRATNLRRNILIAIAIIVPVLAWDLWAHGSAHYLATNALIIGGLLLGIISAQALFVLVRESIVPLHREPLFWVLLSIMVYYLTFIPIFGLYNYLIAQNSPIAFQLNDINNVLFVIRYGCVLTGLVMLYRQATRSHDRQ